MIPSGPFTLTFDLGTAAPPPTGDFRLNNANMDAATTVWISTTTAGTPATDITNVLNALVAGEQLYFQDINDATRWQQYQVTGAPTAASGYYTVPVQWVKGGNDLPAQRCSFSIIPAGQPTYGPPAVGAAPVPPSAPGQAYPIYASGSATSPATPISITGTPIIPPPTIGNPVGVPAFPPPTPPPIGTVPKGALVGPAVAAAAVPPSTAGFPVVRYATGSATSPTAASLFPAYTATTAYTGFPNVPPTGVPIVFANVWANPTLAGGVWTTHPPASTATTGQIILNGWGLPGPSGLGPGPPSNPNPPGAGLPHVASEIRVGDTVAPERPGGPVFSTADLDKLYQSQPSSYSRRKRMPPRNPARGTDIP